jgi:excisionase family DNA binding protein
MTSQKVEVPQLLTVKETMSKLQIGRTTLYTLIRKGEVDSVTIGRARRISAPSVLAFLERNKSQ